MFDWTDYATLARELGARSNDEAAQRSAISRAYHAVYGTARERLIDRDWQAQDGQPHHRVWKTYQESPSEDCRRIGELGFTLRDQRNTADYRRILPVAFAVRDEVPKALRRAAQLLGLLERLAPEERCF